MKIVTDTFVESFVSTNGVKMVKGPNFNWQDVADREGFDSYYLINNHDYGGDGESFTYTLNNKIFSANGCPFKVRDLEEAEQMIKKYLKARSTNLMSLYLHEVLKTEN